MRQLDGKTAVVTGAASGMGRVFANRFAQAGMNVVLADVEEPRLSEAATEVASHGTATLGVVTDVADPDAVERLAAQTYETFGTAHVVCNNAGVAGGRGSEVLDLRQWEWILGVNLWGVVHGHKAFLPRLIEQGEGHIVNTASMAGHLPGHSAYSASKWAVVGITLGLYNQMNLLNTGVGVSCLCPGWVRTDINTSDRNRPEWAAPSALGEPTADQEMRWQWLSDQVAGGIEPETVADLVHDAVTDNTFWIFTDPAMVAMLADKHDSILDNRNPNPPTLGSA